MLLLLFVPQRTDSLFRNLYTHCMTERYLPDRVTLIDESHNFLNASNVIAALYKGDQREIYIQTSPMAIIEAEVKNSEGKVISPHYQTTLPSDSSEPLSVIQQRKALWETLAQRYPPYTEKILELYFAIRRAYSRYNSKRDEVTAKVAPYFENIQDTDTISLLSDILVARQDTPEEAAKMLGELSLDDPSVRAGFNMRELIDSILLGDLLLYKTEYIDVVWSYKTK